MASQVVGNEGTGEHLTQAEISRRFKLLATEFQELQTQEHFARIIVLLNEIGCSKEILPTVKSGIDDIWLPILRWCQPLALGPGGFTRFQAMQPMFLSDAFVINGQHQWPGDHLNLSADAIDIEFMKLPKTLTYKRTLGEGSFGLVAEVSCANGTLYALKRIERKATVKEAKEQMDYIRIELRILRRIRHCHYAKLVASYTDPLHVGILMAPVADCNLAQYLEGFSADAASKSLLAGFFGCLGTALAHLHYVWNIRHKDIKPQNILVKGNNVLFTDFGISLDWSESGHTTTNQEKLRSPVYCAPEVAEGRSRNSMSDIWSLGCVFLEIVAVLKGKKGKFVRDTLIEHGSANYWECSEGILNVVQSLRDEASGWGNEPLAWVEMMLRRIKEERPTSRELRETVVQAKGRGGQLYCGYCCKTETFFGADEERNGGKNDENRSQEEMTGWQTAAGKRGNDATKAKLGAIKRLAVQVHDPTTGTWGEVEMMQNPWSSKNWISADTVAQFHIPTNTTDIPETFAFAGQETKSTKRATVTWVVVTTPSKSSEAEFMVAPSGVPFQLLLGKSSLPER